MLIDIFGYGLNILLLCEPLPAHAWMSFASWESFRQQVPDATVTLATRRPTSGQHHGIFPWAYRLGVRSFFYTEDQDPAQIALRRDYLKTPMLVLPPGTMAMEPLSHSVLDRVNCGGVQDGADLVVGLKDLTPAPLIQLGEGCGGFVTEEWIDKCGHPFGRTGVYQRSNDLTVNERRVLLLWNRLCPIYDSVG